ncbi:hypothetical protein HELRODRAFT_180170 [Helobdella robusta]|uniref:SURP motif domain-containing protein n=1 Tax=Helobdella robusta TaxID=6412 RepID=T1FFJ5_HELRO|nr:hypothetical protein HELRODRAFT_180170 [Helobdella robusta]ESN94818.1 hypothetical protein HELRODRAFT_180170 [Helobdella robusta]
MNFENRWVLRSALNFASDGEIVREVGREFQRKGPEKAKADLAKECLTRVKKKREEEDDRKPERLDSEMKNIIDKLANFVARNGPEFEQMTKQKQKDNPKFSFLFSGEFNGYYQYRVSTEQAIQQVINQQSVKSAPWQQQQQTPTISTTISQSQQPVNTNQPNLREQLEQMKLNAKEQISQSENNLTAQYQNLMQQQQVKLEEVLLKAKKSHTRKNVKDLKEILETISVVPSFCLTYIAAHEEGKAKLIPQLSQQQMKDANAGIAAYQAFLLNEHAAVVSEVSTTTNNAFLLLQQQHHEFVNHLNSQIVALELELQQQQQQPLLQQQQPLLQQQPMLQKQPLLQLQSQQPPISQQQYQQQQHQPLLQQPPIPQQQQYQQQQQQQQQQQTSNEQIDPQQLQPPNFCNPPPFAHPMQQAPPAFRMPPPFNPDFSGAVPPPLHFPDLSKPPPGFPMPPMGFCPPPIPNLPPPPPMFHPDLDLVPTIPYYDLPAGLMAPLVKLGDCEYKSLDPRNIRLPPPMPPTDRLLAAVEAFYSPPSHERPRDADGWEKLSLFEFYKAKNQAKTKKMESTANNVANKVGNDAQNNKSNNKILNNIAREPFNDVRGSRPTNYSRSPSPDGRRGRATRNRSRSYSSSSSKSRSRSGSRSRSRSRSRSGSRSRSPDQFQDMFYLSTSRNDKLTESNKGHQLMKKMGSSGDGIVDPIDHADVRDKQDQFKGLGMNLNDPFESFRKNKSSGFNVRMRERADARSGRRD